MMELNKAKREIHKINGAQDYEVYKWTAPVGYHFIAPDGTNYGNIIWGGKTLSKESYRLAPDKAYNYEKMDNDNSNSTNNDNNNG